MGIYWGQDGGEGSLRDTCASATGLGYIAIAFLTELGSNRPPVLNLAGHCTPAAGTCTVLSDDIRFCQERDIKVLLSIGGGSGNHSLSNPGYAWDFARYLWNAFFHGHDPNTFRPLGDAALDGVDFAIVSPASGKYWDVLALYLRVVAGHTEFYISASPQCGPYGRGSLDDAIGRYLFDFIWMQFYNNPSCDIRGGVDNLLAVWRQWSSLFRADVQTRLFLGLPASPDAAAAGGYIEPELLVKRILREIRNDTNYGGVVLWDRHHDRSSNYSLAIRSAVCPR